MPVLARLGDGPVRVVPASASGWPAASALAASGPDRFPAENAPLTTFGAPLTTTDAPLTAFGSPLLAAEVLTTFWSMLTSEDSPALTAFDLSLISEESPLSAADVPPCESYWHSHTRLL